MVKNKHIYIALAGVVFSIVFFALSDVDTYVQDMLYDKTTHTWILAQNAQPYKMIFYDGIKKVLILFGVSMLLSLLFFRHTAWVSAHKKGMLIVVLSAILIPLVIGGLKKYTNMPCPKNEIHYDGTYQKTAVWEKYTQEFASKPRIKCWPAGHASGGFALLSLVFLLKRKKHKIMALWFALSVGWAMGIYKMLVGDHFLSHTVITMLFAWLIILLIAKGVKYAEST